VTYKLGWAKAVSDALPDGSKVLVAAGPQTDPNTKTFLTAIDQVLGERSDIELLKPLYTDFSTPTSLTDIQDALTANSDVTAILSIYSDVARGAVQAVSQAGKTDDIKIYDIGGSRAALDEVKKGGLTSTIPFDPVGAAEYSVRAIVDAYSGKRVAPVIDEFPDTVGGSVEAPLIIDSSNVDSYAPVY
jgi:ABC-type sugar transport system substrate-binding protein